MESSQENDGIYESVNEKIDPFLKEFETLVKAGCKVIQVVSYERQRVQYFVFKIAKKMQQPWFLWSSTSGLMQWDEDDEQLVQVQDILEPLKIIQYFRQENFDGILIVEDFHPYLDVNLHPMLAPELIRHLREISLLPPEVKKTLILSQPMKMVPSELMKEMAILEVPLPNIDILGDIFDEVVTRFGLSEDDYEKSPKILEAALGLTIMEARLAFSKAIVALGALNEKAIEYIIREKESIIKKRGLLEYYHPEETLEDVGGLDILKDWLRRRGKAFDMGASDFGLDAPRGVLLLGIPGCGKSLSAKAIARAWQFPLLRFDLGKVFGGIVGQSEQNIREALDIAKALAPCVLWIDEIEKGFSGVGSSDQTDSGVTARVFGTFLTWLQEKKEPVFVVATANDISKLPPELLRKGRFDEIFFVDLPTFEERKEIFRIHLRKKKRNPDKFDLDKLARKTEGFTGSEIEEVVKEALFLAFDQNRDLEEEDLLKAIKGITPLSRTMGETIDDLRNWARHRAKFASSKALEEFKKKASPTDEKQVPMLRQEFSNPFIKKEK